MGNERSTCCARFVRGRGRPLLSRPLWLLPCEGLLRFVKCRVLCRWIRACAPGFVCWEKRQRSTRELRRYLAQQCAAFALSPNIFAPPEAVRRRGNQLAFSTLEISDRSKTRNLLFLAIRFRASPSRFLWWEQGSARAENAPYTGDFYATTVGKKRPLWGVPPKHSGRGKKSLSQKTHTTTTTGQHPPCGERQNLLIECDSSDRQRPWRFVRQNGSSSMFFSMSASDSGTPLRAPTPLVCSPASR